MTRVELAEDERAATVSALHAYAAETEHYLRGLGPIRGHDECCATARRRNEELAVQRVALEERRASIRAALASLGAGDQ